MNKTSCVIEKWIKEYEEKQGHYAAFAGFENEITSQDNGFSDWFDELDILQSTALFSFVVTLLEEEYRLAKVEGPHIRKAM